uniref:non-specific serine/threonine protein kinase n=1 Tax=Cyprinus carpio TaxID=7962 RepID=A0A8C1YAI1_CYPCA
MESLSGNYISQLNEYQQKTQCTVEYEEGSTDGPSHNKTFTMRAIVNGQRYPEGTGKSKKEAKLNAAKNALDAIKNTPNTEPTTSSVQNALNNMTVSQRNYTCWLNEYSQKSKLCFKAHESTKMDPRNTTQLYTYVCKYVCGGREFPEACGNNKRDAKEIAAKCVYEELLKTQEIFNDNSNRTQRSEVSSRVNYNAHLLYFLIITNPRDHSNLRLSEIDQIFLSLYIYIIYPSGCCTLISFFQYFAQVGPNMNVQKPAKPSGGQTSNQATKSRFLEDFDSINPIGKGGFGRVFKARRKLENTHYAVKIVKSTKKARREVGALAKFNNANIVRYYSCWVEDTAYRHESSESYSHSDSGSDPGTKYLYIQMEFCEGDTLRAWIDKRNSSNVRDPERRTDAAQINRQVLKAVEYIHKEGLIHRDLKPLNIMFSSEGTVKVGDFGLVTAAENDNDVQLLERTKGTGTRIYMSPEQANQTSYDRKVDIYALGLIYFELIWNLFTLHERKKIWDDIRSRDFPPQFSKKCNFEHKLIDQMLRPRPEERPDASELIRELDRYTNIRNADKDNRTI